jgi:S1-C subfamily serine protease
MLPPRKPAADAASKPASEPISNLQPDANPAPANDPFASLGEDSADTGDADFFSGIVDSSAAPADSVDPFLAGTSVAATGSTTTKSHRPASKSQKAKNQKLIWITAGSIAAVAAVLVVAFIALGGNGGSTADAPAKTGVPTHLVFDWPENERFGAKLEIDGAAREIPLSGAMDFELPTGKHHIALRQLGHAKIDETVQLKIGERYEFKPEWKPAETGDGQGTVATTANPSDADMLVTDALPELKHWSTDLDAAKRQAASAKKDVLVVFFGADNRQWCLQLAKDLLVNKEFRKYADSRFELVLLEAPTAASTVDGKGIGRAAEIAKIAADYTVNSFPTMVVIGAEGTAYIREEYKQLSLVDHLKVFSSGLALQKASDQTIAAAQTGSDDQRVDAAVKALQWMGKNDLLLANAGRIREWLDLSAKVDPNNQKGQYEHFFLVDLRLRLANAGKDDPKKILSAVQPLDDWRKAGRKFKNGDLGASFYIELVTLLGQAGDSDDAEKYAIEASDLQPTDPRLRMIIGRIRAFATFPISSGSGFVFATGGYILTNNHVVDGPGKVFVRIAGEKRDIPAEVVGASAQVDLAVIKMTGEFPELKPLPVATLSLARGTEVVALGYPLPQDFGNLGFPTKEDLKLTRGPISAPPTPTERFYVLDMRVNHGNSGGPLVDMRGEVVGIVSAKTNNSDQDADSYGLAIPGDTVAKFVKMLAKQMPGYHPLGPDESAKLPEFDKLTKVDEMTSPSVVQIVKRRN